MMSKQSVTAKVATARTMPRRRGSGRPPASIGDQTRLRILEAARQCFGDYGYRETSNRIVAETAGLTAGTIYHYFENKRAMFLSVQEQTQKDILETVLAAVAAATSFVEAVEGMLNAFQEINEKHPDYGRFNAVVRTEARRNPEIADARADQEWRRLYHRMSDLGVATGEIDHREARTIRNVLSSLVLGLTQHSIEASRTDHIDCVRGYLRLFQAQLVKPATRHLRIAE